MITVHGISNCDTVKKALRWLQQQNIAFEFRDVRKQPLTAAEVVHWLQQLGADKLINKRSTSWRQLDEQQKQLQDDAAIAQLIVTQPTLFKRPLVEDTQGVHVGFNESTWQQRYL